MKELKLKTEKQGRRRRSRKKRDGMIERQEL